jgi:AraC family transcriptional regulator of adaptative response/methylated-DNA-[protein]-cysteine methyltransferase
MMISEKQREEYYDALITKDSQYEGVFFAAITSTGIFCRPTCTARKPKFENCEFYASAQDAVLAGYRPCKRCHPTSFESDDRKWIKVLMEAVEAEPDKRWRDTDFKTLGVDSSTVRRNFKKRFGMTFVAYARARRMGLALGEIKKGKTIMNAQLDTGYDSASGFRDAFSKIMNVPPKTLKGQDANYGVLYAEWLETKLGAMLVIADDQALYLLEFVDRRGLEREIERLRERLHIAIVPGRTSVIDMIEDELQAYFDGALREFKTPLVYLGSDFQQSVWNALCDIPYGETRSYKEQAISLKNEKGVRAVARANGQNQLAIIVPCHRVIGSDGQLTGYAGGLARKKWLLEHETRHKEKT